MSKEEDTVVKLFVNGASTNRKLEQISASTLAEYHELWKKKQKSYGTGNIGEFGSVGCLIRSSDKIQRLKRHYINGTENPLSDETVEDTWLDLLGYAMMGLMCERGQWE